MAQDSKKDKDKDKITAEEKADRKDDRDLVDNKDESEQLPAEQIQEHPEH